MKRELFLSMLSLLGFSGCSESGGNVYSEPDMYGTPTEDFRFMGTLTDSEGNPIQGINVNVRSSSDDVVTDAEGAFLTDLTTEIDNYYTVTFTDIDGVENGGEFETKQVEVKSGESEDIDGREVFDLGIVTLDEKAE